MSDAPVSPDQNTIAQLEALVQALRARYEACCRELEDAKVSNEQMNSRVRYGARFKSGEVGKTRLRQMTLNNDAEALKDQLEQAESELDRARRWQHKGAKIKRLIELADEAREARSEFFTVMKSVKLGAHTSQLVKAYQRMQRVREAFIDVAAELAPGLLTLKTKEAHQDPQEARERYAELVSLQEELGERGVDLSAVCIRFDNTMRETMWDVNEALPEF